MADWKSYGPVISVLESQPDLAKGEHGGTERVTRGAPPPGLDVLRELG